MKREAAGFTQESLAQAMDVDRGTAWRWEHGRTKPRPSQRRRLARLLAISTNELADLLDDDLPPASSQVLCADDTAIASDSHSLPSHLLGALSALRVEFDQLFAYSLVVEQVEMLEAAVGQHAVACVQNPPIEMLYRLAVDLSAVRLLLSRINVAPGNTQLAQVAAQLATLMADECMVLGDLQAANSWYGTAWAAAESTQDMELMATVLTLSSLLPLYWGDVLKAAELGERARALSGATTCLATSYAPSVSALALAKVGDRQGSRNALAVAREAYDRSTDTVRLDSVFGFSERRFAFYEGRTLAENGDDREATVAFENALDLYPPSVIGDPALIRLSLAAAMVARDCQSGCELASRVLLELPTEHRAPIFTHTAELLLQRMSARQRKSGAVRSFVEVVHANLSLTPPNTGDLT